MAKYLVIVESPAKAKTIKKFLGSGYQVMASGGHMRDLPKSQLGIDLEHNFEPRYITIRGKGELLSSLKKEAKKADKVYLATDPDREGEAISWHLAIALGLPDKDIHRITFNEITKEAVKGSIKKARAIDGDLVEAQQARRVLDRLVGYQISPVLWKKVKKGLSAGRVQSAALKLLCDREDDIADFVQEEFWTMEGEFQKEGSKERISAKLTLLDGQKPFIADGEEAEALLSKIKAEREFTITALKTGKRVRKAPDPFITSTLQQEASKRLNFSPQKTMRVAQQLYEGVEVEGAGLVGLISYLRTDSIRIADTAQEAAKHYIEDNFSNRYAGEMKKPERQGRIQDAHEAIRPTYITYEPKQVETSLSRDQYRLYKLIWERFIASQMAPAEYETQHLTLESGGYVFDAAGSKLTFPGFMKIYQEQEESEEKLEGLDKLQKGDAMKIANMEALQHFTQPPARYTEASLVKALEENGVGRPSTYAPTIGTLTTRGYIAKEKKALYVTELGDIVNQIISDYFESIVDIRFTAQMEEGLDRVEEGSQDWHELIGNFYDGFEPLVDKALAELEKVQLEDEVTDVICEKCGRNMVLKIGRFGKFYACPGFPECRNAKPYFENIGVSCPKCGGEVQIKKTKKGRIYYGCEHNPECDFMAWDRPSEKACPLCGERLYEKNGRQKKLICLKKGCGYTEEINETDD